MNNELLGLNSIIESILNKIKNQKFEILNYKTEFFIEMEEPFEVLIVETNSNLGVNEMLNIEKEISRNLNLYEKNIILELY